MNPENQAAGAPAGTWSHTTPSPVVARRQEAGSAWGVGGVSAGVSSLVRGDSGTTYGWPHSKSPTVPSMTREPDLKPDAKQRNESLQWGAQAPSPSLLAAEPWPC